MRLPGIILISFVLISLSACVLKHNPTSPAMTFKIGPAYNLDSSIVDTSANILIGFTASKGSSDMRVLQVAKAIDTMPATVLSTYALADTNHTAISRDINFKTGVYRTDTWETYTFKISDDAGYTFEKSIAFIVHPH